MRSMILPASTILIAAIIGTSGTSLSIRNQKTGPSLNGASGWLNSDPLELNKLKGKVVLIDFWTYTCVNWRRTLPYVREWAKKYKDQGLVVIGVHTPEFSFEYKQQNVERSIREMDIGYPVALDNNYSIWNSFQNEYWPALYLLDVKGQMRFQKFGEGDYKESEAQIQKLLEEGSNKNVPSNFVDLLPDGFEAAADWQTLRSPENFLGYNRTQGFSSPGGIVPNKLSTYSAPSLELNQWAPSGEWIMGKESVISKNGHGILKYIFHARDLNLIMGTEKPGLSIKFRVLIDGKPPESIHGLDIDTKGEGEITDQRMYQLIRQVGSIQDHKFEIEFWGDGAEVFDFTFG